MAIINSKSPLRTIFKLCHQWNITSSSVVDQAHAITAYNFLHDPRITDERIAALENWIFDQAGIARAARPLTLKHIVPAIKKLPSFSTSASAPISKSDRKEQWRSGLNILIKNHREERLLDSRLIASRKPDFLDGSINGPNMTAFRGTAHSALELASVICLHKGLIRNLFREAMKSEIPTIMADFISQPNPHSPLPTQNTWPDICNWLEDIALKSPEEKRKDADFARLLKALHLKPPAYRWVTRWDDLRNHLDKYHKDWRKTPETWCETLGFSFEDQVPCLLFVYPIPGELMVRPTQLESGWNSLHFPSPSRSQMGHPMDLSAPLSAGSPPGVLPEWIHLTNRLAPEHLQFCAVSTRSASYCATPILRQSHWQRLASTYTTTVTEQMMPATAGY